MRGIIELENAGSVRKGVRILEATSVSFPEGSFTSIMGEPGSGKSTLLKVSAGLVIPSEGEVLFRGKRLRDLSAREELTFRRESAFVFQDAALWANQSIGDNLRLPFRAHHPSAPAIQLEQVITRCCMLIGMEFDLAGRPADLSIGEQKLVSVARALVNDPTIIFLDEPTASLDERGFRRVANVLASFKMAGKTVIMVTHSKELTERFADRLITIRDGRVTAEGPYGNTGIGQ